MYDNFGNLYINLEVYKLLLFKYINYTDYYQHLKEYIANMFI